MESMTSQATAVGNADGLAGRLREENARLCASVAVLEERIKELEARYQRDLTSERSHMESLMVDPYFPLSLSKTAVFHYTPIISYECGFRDVGVIMQMWVG